ncbi:hypothetical protein GCM10022198_00160 [Klugiella xanthotipulae]|uniref:Tape measure domain-containing protein n=1 Tax=Klugiella xanthotipulae TaxID=244735 RepID=A0A543I5F7_9MICO|nr:tape measure protein [Klugiella xanthotipulae]TQM65843.1 tape measure domain-containing protein [Klugiella xanthotipulae]
MSDGVLYVEVMPSTKGIGRAVEKDITGQFGASEKAGTGFWSRMGGLAKTTAKVFGGAVAVVGALSIKGGISRALNIEDAQAKLKGLGHDTKTVEAIMKNALGAVKGTAYGLDSAATVAASAVAAGIKPGKELEGYLRLTADAATIAGTSMEDMGSIINKVTAKGRAGMENLNQLTERGIPIVQWLADEYGVTAGELEKMVSQGKVDSATFRKVIEENIGGAALASGETTRGALANMMAAFSRLGEAAVSGVMPQMKHAFGAITTAVDSLTDAVRPAAERFGGLVELLRTGDFTAAMRENFGWQEDSPIVSAMLRIHQGVAGLFELVKTGTFTEDLTRAFGWEPDDRIVDFLLGIRDGVTDIGPGLKTLVEYFTPLGVAMKVMEPSMGLLQAAFFDLTDALGGALKDALPSLVKSFVDLAVALVPLLPSLVELVASVVQLAASALPPLVTVLASVAGWLTENEVAVQALAIALAAGYAGYLAYKSIGTIMATVKNATLAAKIAQQAYTAAMAGGNLASIKVAKSSALQTMALAKGALAGKAMLAMQKLATAAQWLWNAALSANPIGIIIMAIAALVAGLVWFFTQTELGQEIWSGFMGFLGDALGNIGQWFADAWEWISAGLTDLWEGVLKPIFEGIGAVFTWLWDAIIHPYISLILLYIGLWAALITWVWGSIISPTFVLIGAIFTWLWENAIQPAIDGIGALITWLWETVFLPVGEFIVAAITGIGIVATWLWENVFSPTFTAIGAIIDWVWNSVIMPVAGFIIGVFQGIGAVASWLWANAISPAINAIGGAMNWVWNSIIKPVANFIGDAFRNIGNTAKDIFNGVRDTVETVFGALMGIIRGPVNAVIDFINTMIGGLNGISIEIPDWVPEWGGKTFGLSIPKIPRMAEGGTILPRAGGTLAILAEAGRAESVVDTGKMNALLDVALSGRSETPTSGATVIQHITTVQDDPTLQARQWSREAARGMASV